MGDCMQLTGLLHLITLQGAPAHEVGDPSRSTGIVALPQTPAPRVLVATKGEGGSPTGLMHLSEISEMEPRLLTAPLHCSRSTGIVALPQKPDGKVLVATNGDGGGLVGLLSEISEMEARLLTVPLHCSDASGTELCGTVKSLLS